MKHAVESRIIKGRPYGGTGFLYNKKFSKHLKPLLKYSHERITVLQLETDPYNILLINVYFPYYNLREIDSYLAMYRDTIGFIDYVISQNVGCKFIILADANCNIYNINHPYTALIRHMMERHSLLSCFDLVENFDHNSAFTRSDTKTQSFTLIDHILISNDLKESISNVRISTHGNNLSDHNPVEIDLTVQTSKPHDPVKPKLPRYVNWSKVSQENIDVFRETMSQNLSAINVPFHDVLHGETCCLDDSHKCSLENYYGEIMNAVINAESVIPKTDPNCQKSFWDSNLAELKSNSIDCSNHWKSLGCPKSGPVYDCWKRCHYRYKTEIRRAKRDHDKNIRDAMHKDLLDKNGVSFWKKWNSLNRSGESLAPRINGETDAKGIANSFASHFEAVYGNNDTAEHRSLKTDFHNDYSDYFSNHVNDNISPFLLTWNDMIDIANKLKLGKSSSGRCRPEHIFHGCPSLLYHFHILFNGLIQHGYVPTEFLRGTITPIVKDSQGDLSDTANYRGITLSCLPAKMFEFAIQMKTSLLLQTDELQFGFKKNLPCIVYTSIHH